MMIGMVFLPVGESSKIRPSLRNVKKVINVLTWALPTLVKCLRAIPISSLYLLNGDDDHH